MSLALLAVLVVVCWDRIRVLRPPLRGATIDEVRFLSSVAGELRSGMSLRFSLANAAAAEADPILGEAGRLARSGVPLGEVASLLERLPINGRRAAAALRTAEISGGRSSQMFARLADRAVEEAELIRELRSITTQARMSALVVAAIPLASLLLGGGRRTFELASSGPVGLFAAFLGVALQVVGVAAILWMARA
ncbi:MAG: type II secretion system F family protein [Acidimicrobiia bacterium]|nr:type II secretion system F family protein [Acidimicrobiia bacterium]